MCPGGQFGAHEPGAGLDCCDEDEAVALPAEVKDWYPRSPVALEGAEPEPPDDISGRGWRGGSTGREGEVVRMMRGDVALACELLLLLRMRARPVESGEDDRVGDVDGRCRFDGGCDSVTKLG